MAIVAAAQGHPRDPRRGHWRVQFPDHPDARRRPRSAASPARRRAPSPCASRRRTSTPSTPASGSAACSRTGWSAGAPPPSSCCTAPTWSRQLEASGVEIAHAVQTVSMPEAHARGIDRGGEMIKTFKSLGDRAIERLMRDAKKRPAAGHRRDLRQGRRPMRARGPGGRLSAGLRRRRIPETRPRAGARRSACCSTWPTPPRRRARRGRSRCRCWPSLWPRSSAPSAAWTTFWAAAWTWAQAWRP